MGPVVTEVIVWLPGTAAGDSGQTSCKSVIDSRLVSWAGYCRSWVGFLGGWCRLWVRVLFLYMVWPLPACIFSLSVVIPREIDYFLLFEYASPPFPEWNEAIHSGNMPLSHWKTEPMLCTMPPWPFLKHCFSYINSLLKNMCINSGLSLTLCVAHSSNPLFLPPQDFTQVGMLASPGTPTLILTSLPFPPWLTTSWNAFCSLSQVLSTVQVSILTHKPSAHHSDVYACIRDSPGASG